MKESSEINVWLHIKVIFFFSAMIRFITHLRAFSLAKMSGSVQNSWVNDVVFDIVVIGGGGKLDCKTVGHLHKTKIVVGCAIFREFCLKTNKDKSSLKILLLEKDRLLSGGYYLAFHISAYIFFSASSGNSGIFHCGFDAIPQSLGDYPLNA